MALKCERCGEPIPSGSKANSVFCSVECKELSWQAKRKLQRKYERALQCVQDINAMHKSGLITDKQLDTTMSGIRRAAVRVSERQSQALKTFECSNCGQNYVSLDGELPSKCAYCQAITAWREVAP